MSDKSKLSAAIGLLNFMEFKDVVYLLDEVIQKYKSDNNEQNKLDLELTASMIAMKIKLDREGMDKVLEELETTEFTTNIANKIQGKDN
jgi:hypothetical protein